MNNDNTNPNGLTANPTPTEEQAMPEIVTMTYEINGQEYLIAPEFQKMFPPTATERYEELKEDIRSLGYVRDAIVIWDETGILLDGHTRLKICGELNITPPVHRMSFTDRSSAEMWMLRNQFIRRNLPIFHRIEIALRYKDCIAAKAKANQKAAGGTVPQKCVEAVDTNKELGKLSGTNAEMVRKVRKILREATSAEIKALRQDDVKINTIFKKYDGKKQPDNDPAPDQQSKATTKPAPAPIVQSSNAPEPDQQDGDVFVALAAPEPVDEPLVESETEIDMPAEMNEEPPKTKEKLIDEFFECGNRLWDTLPNDDARFDFYDRVINWAEARVHFILSHG
jgi:hypothetical protein